jgi:hypothetical protein
LLSQDHRQFFSPKEFSKSAKIVIMIYRPQVPPPNSASLLTVSQPEVGSQKSGGSSSTLISRFPNPNYQPPPPKLSQQLSSQQPPKLSQQLSSQQPQLSQLPPPVLLPYTGQLPFEGRASPSPPPPPSAPLPDDPKEWSINQVPIL